MNLYVTRRDIASMSGLVIRPEYMAPKVTHLMLASYKWDKLFIDLDESIPEGSLRFLPERCDSIHVAWEEPTSMHTLHLLIELFPQLDGKLRKAYMKGEDMRGLLHEVWEHGSEAGR